MALSSPPPPLPLVPRPPGRGRPGRRDQGRRLLGQRGEEAVVTWYAEAGYDIAARNWRCSEGEIDLVVVDPDGVLVICEVKTRTSDAFGSPVEAVTAIKQRRLRRLAARWLSESRRGGPRMRPVRFDVAGVRQDRSGELLIDIVHDAF